jgi:hypothetical protein
MKQPYGKIPRGGRTKPAPSADRLMIEIRDRHTLEQFSLELQKMIARLQEHGAHGVEACSVYLKPLDDKGERIALWNEKGEPISRLEISAQEVIPPYRPS